MSRSAHSLAVDDLSAFARSLRRQLDVRERPPSHVEMLNLICRAAGYRNYQAFRAREKAGAVAAGGPSAVDRRLVDKAARHFDETGRMVRWPARARQVELCLWVMWSRLPARTALSEKQIVSMLERWHSFGDHALLRRALVDTGKVERTRDGREYRRIEQPPPAELEVLLARLKALGTAG